MPQTTDLRTVNSLTYADVAGLQLGLPRLPGEETPAYVDRLYRATVAPRDHSYEGTLDWLTLEFGLAETVGGTITSTDPNALITLVPGRVVVGATSIPTAVLGADSYLTWRTLGEVFAAVDALPNVSATLTADPMAPAFQLARQSNVGARVNELITDNPHPCAVAGVIADSLRFNQAVPAWTLTDNRLAFATAPPANLRVSYLYRILPFGVVISEVGLLALADEALAELVVTSTNVLAHQVREYIQAVMKTDRSYWSR